MVEATEETEEFERFSKVINHAFVLKVAMLGAGVTKSTTRCPRCVGWIHARLRGKKNHIHIACDRKCGMSVIE